MFTPPVDHIVERNRDPKGHGEYGMPRGTKKHRGWDIVVEPGTLIKSPLSGIIVKYGHMYANALQFRYVDVANETYRVRLGYVELMPDLRTNMHVVEMDCIAVAQDIAGYWGGGMKPHIHIEVYKNGLLTDPEPLFL